MNITHYKAHEIRQEAALFLLEEYWNRNVMTDVILLRAIKSLDSSIDIEELESAKTEKWMLDNHKKRSV